MTRAFTSVFLLVLGSHGLYSNQVLESLRSACPYNDFCTVGSLMTLNRSMDTKPCCFDCFCDEFSAAFGDSCPDYVPQKENSAHGKISPEILECKPLYFENNFALSKNNTILESNLNHFRFVDFCPQEYDVDLNTKNKCTGSDVNNPSFDDAVAVSNHGSVLFKNKHCALCHGETNVRRWNIQLLSCNDRFEDLQLSAKNMEAYILQNCLVTSSMPDELPINSRTLDCRDNLFCDKSLVYPKIKESCLNGTRMPYLHVTEMGYYHVYKNVYCFNCKSNRADLCPKVNQFEKKSSEFTPLAVLLNPALADGPHTSHCPDYEIFDHRKGGCRRMYCRPLEVYFGGKCVPLATRSTDFHVKTRVIYKPEDKTVTGFLKSISTDYTASQAKFYFSSLQHEFRISSCQIPEMIAKAVFEKSSNTFLFISLDLVYKIRLNCTLRYLGSKIRNGRIKPRSWVLEGKSIKLNGQATFFDIMQNSFESDKTAYVLFAFFARSPYIISKIFLCPYFVFTLHELESDTKTRSEVLGDGLKGIQKLEPDFEYPNGTYPLSGTEIAVCFDRYLGLNHGIVNTSKIWLLLINFNVCLCLVPMLLY